MAKFDITKIHNPIEIHFSKIGRYHYYIFFFLFLCKLPIFWHALNFLFLSPPMSYECKVGTNISLDSCPCEAPTWNTTVFTKTVQTKHTVVCDQAWLISFSESMVFIGSLCGSLAFGFLADKYGRLSMLSLCCLITGISGCLVTVMPNMRTFICMRFIEGFGLGGSIVTSYVLLVEYCGTRHRETVTALYHIPINFGHITLAGVSYLLRDCDHLQLAVSLPLFLFALMKFYLLESPKWLMDNDKIDESAAIMEKILRFNREQTDSIMTELTEYAASQATSSHRKVKFWQIFKHRKLMLSFFCMAFIYFVCGMGYYGVSQYIGRMSGDIHTNVALSGALLLPGTIATVFLLKIINRRPFLMVTNAISGTFMFIVICFPENFHWVRIVVACVCNCFFFISFIIVYLYGVELFPTSVRNSVLGVLSVMSRLGQVVAPPINDLPKAASGAIFGLSALIGALLCYPLPETKNVELPSSLEDTKTLPHTKLALT